MNDLQIVTIEYLSSFIDIRDDYEYVYTNDPHAQIYISWFWLFNIISTTSSKWILLGVKEKPAQKYIAFLPLQIDKIGLSGIYPLRKAGYPGSKYSIHPGLLCLPEFNDEAIRLLANYIQSNIAWDALYFKWVRDPRFSIFMDSFEEINFEADTTKSLDAMRILLPDTFDNYLTNYLGRISRRMIRRRIKFIESEKQYRVTYSTEATYKSDIEALIDLWKNKWKRNEEAKWHRNTLQRYFKNGQLQLSILWKEYTPIAGLACLSDQSKRTYNAYITSYDPNFSKIGPGIVLFTESIKKAIDLNYKYYDFTVGTDKYKQLFGSTHYETNNLTLRRRRLKTNFLFNTGKGIKRLITLPGRHGKTKKKKGLI